MDTKWKSSIKTARESMGEYKYIAIGALLCICSLAVCAVLVKYKGSFSTPKVWGIGAVGDLFLVPGAYLLFTAILERKYQNGIPQNEEFYPVLKKKWKNLQQIMIAGFCALLLLSLTGFGNSNYYGYYWNLATEYYLISSVVLLYFVCQVACIRFIKGRLEMMMERVSEINEDRLAAAVEIERQSLEKAAKSEQLKVDLISNVSHDLKTPLTSIVGYLELLKKEELDDVSRDYVDVISDKAEKLKEMIESLFSLAKASSGNIQISLEPVELNRLIDQIFADMDGQISSSDLYFVKSFTEEDTHLMTDNLHMYRICQNLIENALKYSAAKTRVFIKTFFGEHNGERRLYLEITNTAGYFMDFEKEDIIERFARGDKARSTDGNGLGLAIVSSYAGALGGSFDISINYDQFKATLSFPVTEE